MRPLQIISSALAWLSSSEEASAEGLDVLRHPDLPFPRQPKTWSQGIGGALELRRCA